MGDELLVVDLGPPLVQPAALLPVRRALEQKPGSPHPKAKHVGDPGPLGQAGERRLRDGVDHHHGKDAQRDPDRLDLPEDDEAARLGPHALEAGVLADL